MQKLAVHYLMAFFVITLYGGQVCPFIESLTLIAWASETVVIFSLTFAVNALFLRRVLKDGPVGKSDLVMKSNFVIFLLGGMAAWAYNCLVHGFPIESGLKLIVGWLTIAFFISLDTALTNRQEVIHYLAKTGQHLKISDSYASLTQKFITFAVLMIFFVLGSTFLVVVKDLDWILHTELSTIDATISVLKEFAFIFGVYIAYATRIAMSFSKNLKAYLCYQNTAMAAVVSGDLEASVPISSKDEFGQMAKFTNEMISSLKDRTEALQLTQDVSILSLASLAETRDNETGSHIMRTQRYVRELAYALRKYPEMADQLTDDVINLMYKSAPLHDIGKVGIPDNILLKPGKLTEEEFKIMKRHPYYGKKALDTAGAILGKNSFLRLAEEISYTHHEKWDGTGYPRQLKGDDIPLSGRIMALADVYDALICKRVYKPALSHDKAKEIILAGRGSHFDPRVVDAFLEIEEKFVEIATKYSDSKNQPENTEEH